jgi:hypothetical protein
LFLLKIALDPTRLRNCMIFSKHRSDYNTMFNLSTYLPWNSLSPYGPAEAEPRNAQLSRSSPNLSEGIDESDLGLLQVAPSDETISMLVEYFVPIRMIILTPG